jgi:hypothetical protein
MPNKMAKTTRRMLREFQFQLVLTEVCRRMVVVAAERRGGTVRKRRVKARIGSRMMRSGGLINGGDECHELRWGIVVGSCVVLVEASDKELWWLVVLFASFLSFSLLLVVSVYLILFLFF